MNIIWLNEAPNTAREKDSNGGEGGLWDRRAGYSSTPATTHLNKANIT